jgi:hypothetical protein
MARKIIFSAMNRYIGTVANKPKSAIKVLNEKYRSISKYAEIQGTPYPLATVKACAPVMDSFSLGYIVELWADVHVKDVDGKKVLSTMDLQWQLIAEWSAEQISHFEIPDGYAKQVFKFQHGWIIRTPKGYSSVFTHPYGHPNLPIRTITGYVDTDILKSDVNAPFVIREDFTGVIPKGTPMFQVFPVKRDKWSSTIIGGEEEEEIADAQKRLKTKFWGYYSSRRERKIYK